VNKPKSKAGVKTSFFFLWHLFRLPISNCYCNFSFQPRIH